MLEFLKAHHTILSFVRAFNNPVMRMWLRVYTHFMQSPLLIEKLGDDFFFNVMNAYFGRILADDKVSLAAVVAKSGVIF